MNTLVEDLAQKLVGSEIELNASLIVTNNGKKEKKYIPIPNCNIVGAILENIFYDFVKLKIPELKEGPKQKSPDFFAKKNNTVYNYELKSFKGNPNFDISNYTSFLSQICLNNKTLLHFFNQQIFKSIFYC